MTVFPTAADVAEAVPPDGAPSRRRTHDLLQRLRAFAVPGLEHAVERTGSERFADAVSARDFGAAGDGVTDDTEALQKALTACDGRPLFLPAGTYLLSGTLRTGRRTHLSGAGMGLTYIKRSEAFTGDDATNLISDRRGDRRDSFILQHVTFLGAGDTVTSAGGESERHVNLRDTSRVYMNEVEGRYGRKISFAFGNADEVTITNSRVYMSARDGFNLVNCQRTILVGNRITHCGDDSIAVHTSARELRPDGRIPEHHIIAFNQIEDGFGIKTLGIRSGLIIGNDIVRARSYGIMIGEAQNQGRHSANDVIITDNNIHDLVRFYNADEEEQNKQCYGIWIRTLEPRPASQQAAVPGDPDSSGDFALPEEHYRTMASVESEEKGDEAVLISGRILIANNIISWRLPADAVWPGEGYWTLKGFIEPDLGKDGHIMKPNSTGVLLEGSFEHTTISGTIVEGAAYGVRIKDKRNGAKHRASCSDNSFVRISDAGIAVEAEHALIMSRNNTFDLDPYFEAPAAQQDGSWKRQSARPSGLLASRKAVLLSDGDVFRRLNHVARTKDDAVIDARFPTFIVGAADGVGIGERPKQIGERVVVEGSDPREETFDRVQAVRDGGQ